LLRLKVNAMEETPLNVLESRYMDEEEDDVPVPSQPPPINAVKDATGDSAAHDGVQEEGSPGEEDGEEAWEEEEEEDYYEESDEEDLTAAAAMEWAEMRDGLMAKGYSGLNFNGVSTLMRPNAATNRTTSTLQPRGNVGNQRL
jgi:hypothetical protein